MTDAPLTLGTLSTEPFPVADDAPRRDQYLTMHARWIRRAVTELEAAVEASRAEPNAGLAVARLRGAVLAQVAGLMIDAKLLHEHAKGK